VRIARQSKEEAVKWCELFGVKILERDTELLPEEILEKLIKTEAGPHKATLIEELSDF
jgi:hypothetical protein